jgi:hypothetical protein
VQLKHLSEGESFKTSAKEDADDMSNVIKQLLKDYALLEGEVLFGCFG